MQDGADLTRQVGPSHLYALRIPRGMEDANVGRKALRDERADIGREGMQPLDDPLRCLHIARPVHRLPC